MTHNKGNIFIGLDVLPNESSFQVYNAVRLQHPNSQILCRQSATCEPFFIIEFLIDQKIITQSEAQLCNNPQGKGFQGQVNVEWSETKGNRPTNSSDRLTLMNKIWEMGKSNANQGESFLDPMNCTISFSYQNVEMILYRFTVRSGYDRLEVNLLVWDDDYNLGRNLFDEVFRWERILRKQVWIFDERWEKSKELYLAIENTHKDDIILPHHLLDSMIKDLDTFFSSEELFVQARIPWKRGILLMGPPGNGKTATIRALLQNHLDKSILYIKSFQTGRMGTLERGVKSVFNKARACSPCLLIMEDLDSLVNDSIRSFVLNEIDGLSNNGGIVLIASTNHPDKLDDAFLKRPSRFDRKYTFECPSKDLRLSYIQHWLSDRLETSLRLIEEKSFIEKIVEQSEGWSFALLQELFVSFSMFGLREKVQGIEQNKETLQKALLTIIEDLNIVQAGVLDKGKKDEAKE